MSFLPGMIGARMIPSPPMELDLMYENAKFSGALVTWSGIPIGNPPKPHQRRYIVLGHSTVDSGSITWFSTTLNGSFMQTIVLRNNTTPTVGLWCLEVPTGTTADFAIQYSEDLAANIAVWRMINANGQSAFATASGSHSSGLINLNCNVPQGGVAIGFAQTINGGLSTWTGLTEVFDTENVIGDDHFRTGAQGGPGLNAASPRTISVQNSDTTPDGFQGVAASWAKV